MHLVIVARAAKVNNQRGPGQLFIGRHIRHGGRGQMLRELGAMGWECFGTEFPGQASRDLPFTVYEGDIADLNLPAQSFDAVTLWHVFEHLSDPFSALTDPAGAGKKTVDRPCPPPPEESDDGFHAIQEPLPGLTPVSLIK